MSIKEFVFPPDQNCCGNCTYFDKLPIQKKDNNLLGACHANPPVPKQENYLEESKLGVWPLVLGSFWCGLFINRYSSINNEE